jgi:formate transporter
MAEVFGFDCYAPKEIAERVENVGVTKANLPRASQFALSGHGRMDDGAVGKTALSIAVAKCALPFGEAFFKGVLCNVLVCLAVWLAMAGRSVADKVLAIIFPIAAFVACGFEHSVANMYFIPLAIFLREQAFASGLINLDAVNWFGLGRNLLPVTLGNLFGGAGMVGLVYWIIYRRPALRPAKGVPAP